MISLTESYCNLELRVLQKLLLEYKKRNATLITISPELPRTSLDTRYELELGFPVLSDVVYAKGLGIVWKQPDVMMVVLVFTEWKRMHGNNEMKISVPGMFLVDKNGLVKNVYVETDWHRSETRAALEWMMLEGGKLRDRKSVV